MTARDLYTHTSALTTAHHVVAEARPVAAAMACADYVFYNANKTINKPFKAITAVLTGDPACTAQ
jgi:hypothetical protein